jgi:hypothetical protein
MSNEAEGWTANELSINVVVVESDAVEEPKTGTCSVISTSTGTRAPGTASRMTSACANGDRSTTEQVIILKVISVLHL